MRVHRMRNDAGKRLSQIGVGLSGSPPPPPPPPPTPAYFGLVGILFPVAPAALEFFTIDTFLF